MGLTRWFRRGPSDEEMREELEAHLAMRAEHDGVDHAAARRRLGNHWIRGRGRVRCSHLQWPWYSRSLDPRIAPHTSIRSRR